LDKLVLEEFLHQGQHTAIGSCAIHRKRGLESVANVLQGAAGFESLPDVRACDIQAIVGFALEMEEDRLSFLEFGIYDLRVWVDPLR
jgi:hypothetical protein